MPYFIEQCAWEFCSLPAILPAKNSVQLVQSSFHPHNKKNRHRRVAGTPVAQAIRRGSVRYLSVSNPFVNIVIDISSTRIDVILSKSYILVKQRRATMLTASLRRSGGSLIMTIPQAYVEQNMLKAGSLIAVEVAGEELRLKPARKRKTLSELLAATPKGLHRIGGWDEMPQSGGEL